MYIFKWISIHAYISVCVGMLVHAYTVIIYVNKCLCVCVCVCVLSVCMYVW